MDHNSRISSNKMIHDSETDDISITYTSNRLFARNSQRTRQCQVQDESIDINSQLWQIP